MCSSDLNSVLTVSAFLCGEYCQTGIFTGVPCIINQNGVQRVLQLNLTQEELQQFEASSRVLRESLRELSE